MPPDDGKFPEAVRVLLTWLERGEVNRRNANNFYSMIQSSNGHIRRLTGEKIQHEKEMEEAKEKFKTSLAGIVAQCKFCVPPQAETKRGTPPAGGVGADPQLLEMSSSLHSRQAG